MNSDIGNWIKLSVPEPHAFLLVIGVGKHIAEMPDAVKWIQKNFGKEASHHTVIIFTRVNQLEGKAVEVFL